MRAGLLSETIKVLRPTVNENEVGEQITEYNEVLEIKARNVINRNNRVLENGEIYYPTDRTIEVRIYQDIKDYDIIEWEGKRWRITSIETDKPLMCKRLLIVEMNE